MYIYSVEQELSISKEVIYAAAFMHDIGRIDQIEKGIPHEMAGAALCDRILPDCGFAKEEMSLIKDFILHHRIKTPARTRLYTKCYTGRIRNQEIVLHARRRRNVTGTARR